MASQSILIAGGAGFIGSHLVKFFLEKGAFVTAIDDLSIGKKDNITSFLDNPNFTFIENNIITYSSLNKLIDEVDCVFNFAATVGMFQVINHPIKTLKNNTEVLSRILEVIAKSSNKPLVIHASSSEVYGSNDNPMKETDPTVVFSTQKNHASYPISKLYNEIEALSYYHKADIPVIILRIFNTVGPHQSRHYGMVLPRFLYQAMHNEPISIYGDGLQTRSFCHVKYLCQQIESLKNQPKAIGQIVNVGNRQAISILELAKLVKQVTGSNSQLTYLPFREVYNDNSLSIRHRQPDLTLVEQFTNMKCCWSIESVVKSISKEL